MAEAEVLGVEVGEVEETVVGVAVQVEVPEDQVSLEDRVKVKAGIKVAGVIIIDGPTLKSMQITLHRQSAGSITFTGSLLIGVRSRRPAHGKISGSLKINNETVASLTLVTFKIFCTMTSIRKYMRQLT